MKVERFLFCFIAPLLICSSVNFHSGISDSVRSSVDSTLKHQYNTSTGVYLKTSGNVTVRVGSKLQLNCTIIGAELTSKPRISLYKNGGQKVNHNTTVLSNDTIQLEICPVDWTDNGTYTCKQIQSGNNVQPSLVFVKVGDAPSQPEDVWMNNINFRTYMHWKRPAYTGGLQISYSVQGQCKNTSFNDPECTKLMTLCETDRIDYRPETTEFVCNVINILPYQVYTAFVMARNSVGSNRSRTVDFESNPFNPLLTTPPPPVIKEASEERHGSVKLAWQDLKDWRPITVEYIILYHKDGDKLNKSETVYAPSTNAVITGLSANARYHFYLMARFGMKEDNRTVYGIYSDSAVWSYMTAPSAPSRPPTINCSQLESITNEMGQRNVTIVYKVPQSQYFNGYLKEFQINYTCQRKSQEISGNLVVYNTSEQHAVITGLRVDDKCHVWMRMCNNESGCSGISNVCNIVPQDSHVSEPAPVKSTKRRNKMLSVGLGSAIGIVLVIILVVLCRSRRRQNRGLPHIDLSSLALPRVVHGYDEMEEPLVNNNAYNVLNLEPTEENEGTRKTEQTS